MYNVLRFRMQTNLQNPRPQPSPSVNIDTQPSHYEFEPFDAEKLAKEIPPIKTKSAGEYEVPVMDNYELHAADPKTNPVRTQKNNLLEFINSKKTFSFMEKGMHLANSFNILTSGVTALGSAVSKNTQVQDSLQSLASFGAKVSMGVNSLFNILNGHKTKDLANVVGYLGELIVALKAPYEVMGLLRGATFSTYQTSNILSNIEPMKESKTYGDYINQVKDRLPKLYKKLFQLKTYTNLSDNAGAITGGWGSLLSYSGVLAWATTGSTKLGGFVKGIGELLVDAYQVLTKEHWLRKKQFYIGSGISFIIGSLCEFVSKQRDNDPVTMALYFFGSGIGRSLYTISNILGEDKYGPNGPTKSPNILSPFNFNFSRSKPVS